MAPGRSRMTELIWCVGSIMCLSAACPGQSSRLVIAPVRSAASKRPSPVFADRLPLSVRRGLEAADVGIDRLRVAFIWFVTGLVVALLMYVVVGPAISACALAAVFIAPAVQVVRLRDRRAKRLIDGLAPALDAIAHSMHAGLSLRQAIGEAADGAVGPLAVELRRIVRAAERGRPLEAAIDSLSDRFPRSEVRIAMAALALAANNEAGATRALAGVGVSLRDSAALDAEVKALISQAQASIYVTAGLPIVFVGFSALVDPASAALLVSEPFGRFCLAVGATLDVLGFVWMRRLVRRLS